jgi:hypothetical protein
MLFSTSSFQLAPGLIEDQVPLHLQDLFVDEGAAVHPEDRVFLVVDD